MLRWMDGFEKYGDLETHMLEGVGGAAAWSTVAGWSISTASPATGSRHMRCTAASSVSQTMRRALGQSKQISGLGYRFAMTALPDIEQDNVDTSGGVYMSLVEFRDVANGEQIRVNLGTEGSVRALRGNTALGRSDPCVAAGGYHHFECKASISNTGYVEVRINEVTVLNLTSIDTQNTANAENSQFRFGMYPVVTNTVSTTMDLDDCYAWDDDATDAENTVVNWVGDKGYYYLRTNADTATSEFDINGSATAYGALDDIPPNGTDYLDTALTAARAILGVEALPGNVSEIIAMSHSIYTRKEESGTVTMRGGIVVGTDETYGPDDSPSTAYAYIRPGPKTIDPSTGVPWASDAVPELLIERTA